MDERIIIFLLAAFYFLNAYAMDAVQSPDAITLSTSMAQEHRKIHQAIKALKNRILKKSPKAFTSNLASAESDSVFDVDFEQLLGEGEESQIYLAQLAKNDQPFLAARIFKTRHIKSDKFQAKIAYERRLLEYLEIFYGESTITIEDTNRTVFFIKYLPGMVMNNREALISLPLLLKAIIAKEILVTTVELYKRKVFHRDLKLSNMHLDIVNGWPVVHLLDFGHACFIEDATNEFYGTPFMQPPEAFYKNRPTHSFEYAMYTAGKAMAHFLTSLDVEEYYIKKPRFSYCRHKIDYQGCVDCSFLEFLKSHRDIFINTDIDDYRKNFKFIDEVLDTILWLCESDAKKRPSFLDVNHKIARLTELERPLKNKPLHKNSWPHIDRNAIPRFGHKDPTNKGHSTLKTPRRLPQGLDKSALEKSTSKDPISPRKRRSSSLGDNITL